MPVAVVSGTSTPLSSSSTLAGSPPPSIKKVLAEDVYKRPQLSASNIIEHIASRSGSTSTVHIYDLAEQAGFGVLTKLWAESDDDTASVVRLQTRAGAGLSLVGRLSEGTSQETVKGAVLTAYTTPTGLAAMAQSLSYLPNATPSSRLVVQVPTVTPVGEAFTLSPTLAPLATALTILPTNIAVIASATPQESVDLTALSYRLKNSHVVHLFDHHSSSREIGHTITPPPLKQGIDSSLAQIIKESGYSFFDYAGDKDAESVVVLLNGPLALAARAYAASVSGLGVVVVRVLRPWDESALREVLPTSVKEVHVFDDVPNNNTQGILYTDVFGSLLDLENAPYVRAHRITPANTQSFVTRPHTLVDLLRGLAPNVSPPKSLFSSGQQKKLLFFSTPSSPLAALPHFVEDTFLPNLSTRLLTDHDIFSKAGGVTADRMILSPKGDADHSVPIPTLLPISTDWQGESDFLGVLDHTLLKTHNILTNAKPTSAVLVVTPWTREELSANLSSDVVSVIQGKGLHIYTIDAKASASTLAGATSPVHDAVQALLVHLAFLRLYLGTSATESLVHNLACKSFGQVIQGIELKKINAHAWAGLNEIKVPTPPPAAKPQSSPTQLKHFEFNAIAVETDNGDTVVNGAKIGSWHDAARHLLFPSVFTPPSEVSNEEYPPNPALRPEVPDRTYLVTTAVNRRLTPLEYNRNIFHLEFDTSGTGLKYAIGEALGVHGWNDEQEVLDFCSWYGVNPNQLVTIPVANGEGKLHTRTIFQALQQQIDVFGRPPKSFYSDLAPYAINSVDRHALLFIGSPEGSATFKKLAEKDTVTFAEVLQRYPSAKPPIEILCELIGDIKPRHYSIASAQSVVGDRVDLLVVTVDWVTPSGSPRYGQCTRYLAGLKIGQKVTVSIKPSVMKLPPDNLQPLIMAGLGTGAAPFRAFLQHRAWQAQQGIEVGPCYYYFGARHQSEEYLYGEEIEAFILDGTITKAGLAWSRDQPKKVYIQHKMLEDSEVLSKMLHNDKGVFYLCGPTWPVPDVYEALVNALVKYEGFSTEAAGGFLEGLKEEERYVLEVY